MSLTDDPPNYNANFASIAISGSELLKSFDIIVFVRS